MGESPWKRLQKDGSCGERSISMGALVGTGSQSQKCQSQQRALQSRAFGAAPHGYFLALLDTLLRRTPPNCELNSKRMCQLFSLPSVVASAPLCAGSDSCPSALVSCAPAPPFSFFLTVGKPKARFPRSCWHSPSCKPLSSLSFARALWKSCLVSSRIYQ